MTTPDIKKPRPRKPDRSVVPVTFLPTGNRPAGIAYLCAVFGMIPVFGLILGPLAVLFGFWGGIHAKREESHRGRGHAFVSRCAGALETICNVVGLWLIASANDWI